MIELVAITGIVAAVAIVAIVYGSAFRAKGSLNGIEMDVRPLDEDGKPAKKQVRKRRPRPKYNS
jgi:hypothetical protein